MCDIAGCRDEIKALLANTPGNSTAKLIALLRAIGVADTTEISNVLGLTKRGVRKAKGGAVPRQANVRNGRTCSSAFRARVINAFAGICEYCGRTAGLKSVDRIMPGSRGGLYMAENVTMACGACNSKKRNKEFVGPVRSLFVMESVQ